MGNEASIAVDGLPLTPGLQKCARFPLDSTSLPGAGDHAVGGSGGGGGGGEESLPRLGPRFSAGAGSLVRRHAVTVAALPGVLEVYAHLGSGSYSHVFRCRVAGEMEPVAVKLCMRDQNLVLSREASLLLGLRNANLVQLRRVIEGPPAALFLELCEGGELKDLLHGAKYAERIRAVGLKSRVQAWLEVACALEYLHSKTIVHRDIASDNCFLSASPESVPPEALPPIKLGDLSVSRHIDTSCLTVGVGSSRYMAPEVMEEEKYGYPVDIYSAGILAHELITGQIPYESPGKAPMTEVALILSIASGLRPSLEDLPAHPKRDRVQALIASCWDREPETRPNAEALVEKLRQMVWSML